jgi:hypothetical protein
MAGFLACSGIGARPSHYRSITVTVLPYTLLTVAETAPDSHGIPFYARTIKHSLSGIFMMAANVSMFGFPPFAKAESPCEGGKQFRGSTVFGSGVHRKAQKDAKRFCNEPVFATLRRGMRINTNDTKRLPACQDPTTNTHHPRPNSQESTDLRGSNASIRKSSHQFTKLSRMIQYNCPYYSFTT